MGRMKQIRQEAPLLLEATKKALVFVRSLDAEDMGTREPDRQAVMQILAEAINTAEPPTFDPSKTTLRLVMTHPSYRALHHLLQADAWENDEGHLVLRAVDEGFRETKQRVYVTLSINPRVLKRLHFLLTHKAPSDQKKSFGRLAEQIEEDGLGKNPMEILGSMGL